MIEIGLVESETFNKVGIILESSVCSYLPNFLDLTQIAPGFFLFKVLLMVLQHTKPYTLNQNPKPEIPTLNPKPERVELNRLTERPLAKPS